MDNNLLDDLETPNIEHDELPLWQKIVFIIIPLIGFIAHFAMSRRRPHSKQQALQFAAIGFCLNLFFRFVVS